MPYTHWFVSRQKRKLTTILPALVAFSDICVGKKWAGNKDLQLQYEDELQRRDITVHGTLRARRSGDGGGGVRTLFKQMKDLGLVFTEDDNGLCRLTLIAEALIKGELTFVDAMRIQLQRYQYPSAACWSGSGSVHHSFMVHPFQFLLRLLRYSPIENYLTMEEIAYIVIHTADSDDEEAFNAVAGLIIKNRQAYGQLPLSLQDKVYIKPDMPRHEVDEVHRRRQSYYDIANTLCNYISLTQFIDRGFKTISIRSGKETEVDAFIQSNPKFIPHPELKENYLRAYGRGNVAKDLRDFNRDEQKSSKEITEARIRKEYVLLALKTPITGITPDVVQSISHSIGIDEITVEKFLIKNYPQGNIADFFGAYRESAHLGKAGARDFEIATCEMFGKIFNMRAKHVGPLGNTPDVFIESDEAGYCGIIDNKAYKNDYSISGNHRRVMEHEYIPNVGVYGNTKYSLAFFTYIAGSFGSNINSQIQTICRDTSLSGSAITVDILINLAQDYAENGYDHNKLRDIFSVNREVQLLDIQ